MLAPIDYISMFDEEMKRQTSIYEKVEKNIERLTNKELQILGIDVLSKTLLFFKYMMKNTDAFQLDIELENAIIYHLCNLTQNLPSSIYQIDKAQKRKDLISFAPPFFVFLITLEKHIKNRTMNLLLIRNFIMSLKYRYSYLFYEIKGE